MLSGKEKRVYAEICQGHYSLWKIASFKNKIFWLWLIKLFKQSLLLYAS